MTPERRLLREYVREALLTEDDTYAVYSDLAHANAAMMPYGMNFGSGGDLYRVFVKPFVDVVDTTLGKTKEVSQRAQTATRVAFETVANTLLPWFRSDYERIFAKEKKELDAIRREFADVYQANVDAFRDNDVFWTAFCYSPAAIITHQLVRRSPKTAMKLISTLTGGSMDDWLQKVFGRFRGGSDRPPKTGLDYAGSDPHVGGHGGGGGGWGGYYDAGYGPDYSMHREGLVYEAGEKDKKKEPALEDVLTDPRLLKKVSGSDVAKRMHDEAQAAVRGSLQAVFKHVSAALSAQTLQDLQHRTGKQIKGVEGLASMQPQERQKAERAILDAFRRSLKDFVVKNLESQAKKALDAGVPKDSEYVSDYEHVIQRLRSL